VREPKACTRLQRQSLDKQRNTVKRVNARLKDNFGVCRVNVRGHTKVLGQMMFAVLAFSADQLLGWCT
jgi:hypothetical protein